MVLSCHCKLSYEDRVQVVELYFKLGKQLKTTIRLLGYALMVMISSQLVVNPPDTILRLMAQR